MCSASDKALTHVQRTRVAKVTHTRPPIPTTQGVKKTIKGIGVLSCFRAEC